MVPLDHIIELSWRILDYLNLYREVEARSKSENDDVDSLAFLQHHNHELWFLGLVLKTHQGANKEYCSTVFYLSRT